MNLDELLKVNIVRCIKTKVDEDLVEGETYRVEGFNDEAIKIVDRNGYSSWHNKNLFEPVPNNDMSKPNSEIDIGLNSVNHVIPTFKVGDKVYFPNMAEGKVLTLFGNKAFHYPFFVNVTNNVNNSLYELDNNGRTKYGNFTDVIVKATQENYEMLCKLYPHIEFELPPKEITGSDLCCLMLRNKHTNIMCQVDGDETNIRIITLYTGDYFYDRSGNRYSEVVPIDTKGIPLTEGVLNETI